MRKVIYSTDVDLLQSSLIVFDDNSCIFIEGSEYDFVNVYSFDVVEEICKWMDVDGMNSSCDSSYDATTYCDAKIDVKIAFTNDLCWYHGANNLDATPDTYTQEDFEIYISFLT